MRRTWLLVVALIIPAACQPASEASDPAADEAAIRAVLQGLETTWNAGDLDSNAEYVDGDMVSLPPGEPPIRGEAANRQEWDEMLATTDNEWHPFAPGDLGLRRSRSSLGRATGFDGPKGGEVTEGSSKNVWVFRRGSDGVWRMLLEAWSEDSTN